MALGVDLLGVGSDGSIAWRWTCRHWSGFDVLQMISLPETEPGVWEALATGAQIEALRMQAGGRETERQWQDPDLDALLAIPVAEVIVRVEEWGGFGG